MSKPVIKYISLWGGGCGLSTSSKSEILRSHGTANVQLVRPATQKDVEWVRAFGGYVPDGRIEKATGESA